MMHVMCMMPEMRVWPVMYVVVLDGKRIVGVVLCSEFQQDEVWCVVLMLV